MLLYVLLEYRKLIEDDGFDFGFIDIIKKRDPKTLYRTLLHQTLLIRKDKKRTLHQHRHAYPPSSLPPPASSILSAKQTER